MSRVAGVIFHLARYHQKMHMMLCDNTLPHEECASDNTLNLIRWGQRIIEKA